MATSAIQNVTSEDSPPPSDIVGENTELPGQGITNTSMVEPVLVEVVNDGTILNTVMLLLTLLGVVFAGCSFRHSAETAKRASKDSRQLAEQMQSISDSSTETLATNREQLEQYHKLVTAISRPRMNARLSPPRREKGWLMLIVENVGVGTARNVKVSFNPPLPEPNLEKLNSHSSRGENYLKAPVAMVRDKFEDRVFPSWSYGVVTEVPFWVMKFDQKKASDTRDSDRFVNDDGTPMKQKADPEDLDGEMLFNESAEGIPANVEIIFEYEDDEGVRMVDPPITLNPDVWIATTFRSVERSAEVTQIGGPNSDV